MIVFLLLLAPDIKASTVRGQLCYAPCTLIEQDDSIKVQKAVLDSLNRELQLISEKRQKQITEYKALKVSRLNYDKKYLNNLIDSLSLLRFSLEHEKDSLLNAIAQIPPLIDVLEKENKNRLIFELLKRYEDNQEILAHKYSEIPSEKLDTLLATELEFKDMNNYGEYHKGLLAADLYGRCTKALNSPYNSGKIRGLRDELAPYLKKGNTGYGLSNEQFVELDSLDIKLSRYMMGVSELQAIVDNVNNDGEVIKYRAEGRKSESIDRISSIVKPTDEYAISVYKRYFSVIPYLKKMLESYWQELQAKPFDTPTPSEKQIMQLELE